MSMYERVWVKMHCCLVHWFMEYGNVLLRFVLLDTWFPVLFTYKGYRGIQMLWCLFYLPVPLSAPQLILHLALDFLAPAALTQFAPREYEGGRRRQCVRIWKLAFDLVSVSVCLCAYVRFHLYFLSFLLISTQLVSVKVSECDLKKWTRCLLRYEIWRLLALCWLMKQQGTHVHTQGQCGWLVFLPWNSSTSCEWPSVVLFFWQSVLFPGGKSVLFLFIGAILFLKNTFNITNIVIFTLIPSFLRMANW